MALWTPLNLQSVKLEGWYRINDPAGVLAPGADVLTAGAVGNWKDRSGNGRDLIREGSGHAWNPDAFGTGNPGIEMTGAGQWRTAAGMAYPKTVLGAAILLRSDVGSNDSRAVSLIVPNGADPFDSSGVIPVSKISGEGKVGYWYSFSESTTSVPLGAPTLVEGVPTSLTTAKTVVNGVDGGSMSHANLGVYQMDRLGIMGTGQGGNGVKGATAEALLWSGVIDPAELEMLRGYYAWNNRQQLLLPAGSTYRSAAPTVAGGGGGTTPTPAPDPIPLKPLARGGAFAGRSSGRLVTLLRPRPAGSTFPGRFTVKIGLSLALRASVARFSGQARPQLATRLQFRPAGGAFAGRGQLTPASPGRFLPARGAFGARARLALSTAFRARQAPEAFAGRSRSGIGFTFGPLAAGGAFQGRVQVQVQVRSGVAFLPRPAAGVFKASSHASIAVQVHAQPASGQFGGAGRLWRLGGTAVVLTPQQSGGAFVGRARLALATILRGHAPELFTGRSAVRIRYSFRGLPRGGSFFARGFVVPVNPAADGRPYGPGDYGVGNYGTGTDVGLAVRGAARMSAWAKPAIGPVFHPKASRSTFKASARFVPWVAFRARPAVGRGAGQARTWIGPVFHPRPSTARFSGRMAALLQGKEMSFLPGAMPAAGSVRAVLSFRAPFLRSPIRASGRTGRLRTVIVWHKGPRLGASWSGHWTAQVHPQVRVRGRELFRGRAGARMLFKAPFYASPGRYAGHVVVSYSWSNLTAPGRAPAPDWAPAIPGASPLDPWSLVPAAPSAWDRVE